LELTAQEKSDLVEFMKALTQPANGREHPAATTVEKARMMAKYLIGCICALWVGLASAAEFEVRQKNKAFGVDRIKVKVGDTVNFLNDDPFFHNVFSLSKAKTFDLGSYPKGQGRKITFDEPGAVFVECAIHPDMKMTIDVAM
jgi:plastocyanin